MNTRKGFTLVEMISYMTILVIVILFVTSLFVFSSFLFGAGTVSVDVQESMNRGLMRLSLDLQESDMTSIAAGYVAQSGSATFYPAVGVAQTDTAANAQPQFTTAIIMLSARDSLNQNLFDYSSPTCSNNDGSPCWRTWICYYLTPNPSTGTAATVYSLARVAVPVSGSGIPIGAQALAAPSTVSAPPGVSNWETIMRGKPSAVILSTGLNRFCITNAVTNPITQLYQNPYSFDTPSASTIVLTGLPNFWINIQSSQTRNAAQGSQTRNTAQVLVRN